MRWRPVLLSLVFLHGAPADEPIPAVASPAASVGLGGRFAPPEGTTVRWQTRTEFTGGTFTGFRGIVPIEGKIDKIDEREILITYGDGKRDVMVVKGLSSQIETVGKQTETKEKHQALEGVPVRGLRTNDIWSFAPASGEPTDAQKPELERLARRANEEVDMFEGTTVKPGDTWDLDPLRFLKAAGFDDVTSAKGIASATLKEVRSMDGASEAVIGLKIDLRAVQTPAGGRPQRLHVEYTGSLVRVLTTKLDRLVDLEGRMSLTGETLAHEDQRQPFTLVAPVKLRSQRQIVPK